MTKWRYDLTDVAAVGAAISDPGRLRLLMALDGRRLCVCQLTELLKLAPSTVSKHLSILKQAGLIQEDKSGRWVFHELAADEAEVAGAITWLRERLKGDATITEDRKQLKLILKMNAEELCKAQIGK